MNSPLAGVVALVAITCWVMSIYKLRDLIRDRRNLPLRALWIALMTITLSLSIQPWTPQIDRAFGILDIVRVVSNCLTLISAAAAQAFLLYVTGTDSSVHRRVRRRVVAAAGCVAGIIVLFIATPPPYPLDHSIVTSGQYRAASGPPNPNYTYLYMAYLGYAMAEATVLATRYARIATRPLLRIGLRLIAAGCMTGLGYLAIKLAAIIAKITPGRAPVIEPMLVTSYSVAILLILIGSTMPSWGPRLHLDRLAEQLVALRAYRRLGPLWRGLHTINPQMTLLPEPHGPGGWWRLLRQARLRLVRRVVEIRDAYVVLRPYTDPTVAQIARRQAELAGLSGPERDAVIEAAVLAATIHARRAGRPAIAGPATPLLTAHSTADPAAEQDPAAEVDWLGRIATVYRRSPIVAHAIRQASTGTGEVDSGRAESTVVSP